MKRIAYHTYGSPDVLQCEEVAVPLPGDDQVLLRVRAAALNALDVGLLKGEPRILRLFFGYPKPKVSSPGRDVAGVVETVGRNVTGFKRGDEVFGVCFGKGWGDKADGAFAEYARTVPSALALKPPELTFEQAAALPVAGLTALQALRDKGAIQPEQSVLIHGAGGGVGTFAVQIAKALGASVTAVSSTANLDLMRSMGADHVIDYTREDFTRSAFRFDIVLDCHPDHSPIACGRVLKPRGKYIPVGGPSGHWIGALARIITTIFIALVLSPFARRKLVFFMAKVNSADLEALAQLAAAGKLKPVIDRSYSLADVPEAFRYLNSKHAHGKVVVTVA